jgi:cellulose synthase (UDP-forming)
LRSLLQILLLALRGLAIVLIGLLMPHPAQEREPLPRRAGSIAASLVFLALLLRSVLVPAPVFASETRSGEVRTTANQPEVGRSANFHDEFALGAAGGTKTLSLQRSGASLNFFFGEPVNKVATNATLQLNYAAPTLGPNEARLEVTLNDAKVGSIELFRGPSQQAEFSLPTDLITSDNTLSFQLQETCVSCRAQKDLWITINPASTIKIDGTRLPLENDLSLLPLPFFDPAGLGSWSLSIIFGDRPDAVTLKSAALVASWFGVLSDVRNVHFPVSVGQLSDGNAVVFALRGSGLIADLSLPFQAGPLLAMRDNPHDPYGKLLVVTGDSADDLLQAARALTSATWMPHVDSVRAHAASLSVREAYDAPRWLEAGRPSAIGTYTTNERLKLQGTGSITLYFRLPPDLFLRARQSVPLLLRYEYGGAPEESRPALHVRLNGRDIDSIQLKPASSPVEESETVRLPTGSLLAYTNTLTIDFYFARNTPTRNTRPSFAIRRDSSLDLRGLPHSVVLPRLELFADAGYPFTRWPDVSRTAVIMPHSPSPTEYEALLDMAGFFGAQTGATATGIEITDPDDLNEVQDKDLVLIGTPGSQPLLSKWAGDMPVDLSASEMHVNEAAESALFLHPAWPFRGYDGVRIRHLLDGESIAESNLDALVESFVSPVRSDRLVVTIIPCGPNAKNAIRDLFAPSKRQGPIYGGVAVSQNGRFESFLVGMFAYHSGNLNRYQYATVLLFENYFLIPLLVLLLAGMIVAWVRWCTERIAARRLATRES